MARWLNQWYKVEWYIYKTQGWGLKVEGIYKGYKGESKKWHSSQPAEGQVGRTGRRQRKWHGKVREETTQVYNAHNAKAKGYII